MPSEKIDGTIRPDFNDILFEGRNKRYGAYVMRKSYPANLFRSFFISLGLLLAVVLYPSIRDLFTSDEFPESSTDFIMVDELPQPPDVTPMANPPAISEPEETIPKVTANPDKDTLQTKPKPNVPNKSVDSANLGIGGNNGKDTTGKTPGTDDNDLYYSVDEVAHFPGDLKAFISRNLHYPEQEKILGREGVVYVSFIVEKDGSLSEIKIARQLSPGLDAEAIRVVKAMPNWQPALNGGKPVRLIMKLPIRFKLSQ